ncbi:MAG: hypothetical protein KDA99_15880, partial [Planctomycetales bacterium]|nr:hypothetical protein [Planctomycetales bacterium]
IDTINVEDTRSDISIYGQGGRDEINLAPGASTLDLIRNRVYVRGDGNDRLVFHNFNDSGQPRTYNLTRTTVELGSALVDHGGTVGYLQMVMNPNTTLNVPSLANSDTVLIQSAGTVNVGVGDAAGVLGHVAIRNTGGRFTNLIVDDSLSTTPKYIEIDRDEVRGVTPFPIDFKFSSFNSISVKGGLGDSTSGNRIVVLDTRTTTRLLSVFSGAGDYGDVVNVQGNHSSVWIHGDRGPDIVNVGKNGTLDGLHGFLTITNYGDWSAVNVDDSANTRPKTVTLANSGIYASIVGLAPAPIRYRANDLRALNLKGGSGGNVFNVSNTVKSTFPDGSQTVIHGGIGADTFNVLATTGALSIDTMGNNNQVNIGRIGTTGGSISRMAGNVTLIGDEAAGGNLLNVYDPTSTARYVYNMTSGQMWRTTLAGTSPTAAINYSQFPFDAINLLGADHGNRFVIAGTPPSTQSIADGALNIVAGNGNDEVSLLASGLGHLNIDLAGGTSQTVYIGDASHNLDGILADVLVAGQGTVHAYVDDQASAVSRQVSIDLDATGTEVLRRSDRSLQGGGNLLNTFAFRYSAPGSLHYQAGRNDVAGNYNQIDVFGVPAGLTVDVTGGPDYDLFTVGFAGDVSGTQGRVNVHSPQPDLDFAYFYDYTNATGQTYAIYASPTESDAVVIDRPVRPNVSFAGVTQLIFIAPLVGGNVLNVQSVPAGTYLNAQVSNGDRVKLGSLAPALGGTTSGISGPVAVSSYHDSDNVQLTIDDSGNMSAARDVTLASYVDSGTWGLFTGLAGSSIFFRDHPNWNVDVRGGQLNDHFVSLGTSYAATISLYGGGGNDVLVGNGGVNLLGGAGRDLLIAGATSAELNGGTGQDILIGGAVNDVGSANLDAIMAIWNGTGNYALRASLLNNGPLAAGNVTGNGGSNSMTGGADNLDLFYGSIANDLDAGEINVAI